MKICITGGIACGKSLVGGFMDELGVPVCDSDDIYHELIAAGGKLHGRIVSQFGGEIVGDDGEINRSVLGKTVFSDPEKRLALNRVTHPAIRRELNAWVREHVGVLSEKCVSEHVVNCVAAIVPLVFEVEWEHVWDKIVCVSAPASLQVERLKNRGFSEAEAAVRIDAQLALAEKMKRADYVIFNSGNRSCVKDQTARVFYDIVGQIKKENGKGV